jgi:hypothetical protein
MATTESASKIRFTCDACGAAFAVAPALAGRRAVCKRCRSSLIVPGRPAELPPVQSVAQPAASPSTESGPHRRRAWRIAWVFALAAAVGVAGTVFLYGDHFKSSGVKSALARMIGMNEATLVELLAEPAIGCEPAEEQTARLIAELESIRPGRVSAPRDSLLEFLRAQERFLRAKIRSDRLNENAAAAVGLYRRHLWHPPAESRQWPLYLEQTESLRQALRQQLSALQEASAVAFERHSELVEAEKDAAAGLAAEGLGMATHFGDSAERMQRVLAETGGQASGGTLEF